MPGSESYPSNEKNETWAFLLAVPSFGLGFAVHVPSGPWPGSFALWLVGFAVVRGESAGGCRFNHR
jgi:hypothetical protein